MSKVSHQLKSQEEHSLKGTFELKSQEDHSLKGTFASVLLLGGFLAVTWLGVFALFISRG